jgi:hypothetical protein
MHTQWRRLLQKIQIEPKSFRGIRQGDIHLDNNEVEEFYLIYNCKEISQTHTHTH